MWSPYFCSPKTKYKSIPKDRKIRRNKKFYVVFRDCRNKVTRYHNLTKQQALDLVKRIYQITFCTISHCIYYYFDELSWRQP